MRILSKTILLYGFAAVLCAHTGMAQATLNVLACEPEWAALAEQLGGDRLNIYSATTMRQDPHRIEARPSLIAKARKADLLICTGAELEIGWLPLLLRRSGNARIQVGQLGHFLAYEHVDMLDVPERLDRSLGDLHAAGNPHIHTDPRNILRVAGPLSQRLQTLDPDHADHYRQRHREFERAWQQAIEDWNELGEPLKGTNIVVHHEFWPYLIDWLGLNKLATLEPVPGVSPSTRHLAEVKQLLETQQAKMIFNANYLNERPVRWLSEQTGLAFVTLPSSVDHQNGETLQQWYDRLLNSILEHAE